MKISLDKGPVTLIWTLWCKNEAYDPDFQQKDIDTSSIGEPKLLFSLSSGEDTKQVAPNAGATQDELPCNERLFNKLCQLKEGFKFDTYERRHI